MPIKLPEDASYENLESWSPGGMKVAPGVYEAKIIDVEVQTDQKGFPKLNLKYEVIDGEFKGGVVFGTRSLQPNTLNYFRGFCEMVNVSFKGSAFDEKGFIGRICLIDVREYQKQDGSVGVRVDSVYPSQIGQNDPVDLTMDPAQVDFQEEQGSDGPPDATDVDDNVPF